MTLEFLAKEWCRLAAAGIAGLLATEENEIFVGTGASFEGWCGCHGRGEC